MVHALLALAACPVDPAEKLDPQDSSVVALDSAVDSSPVDTALPGETGDSAEPEEVEEPLPTCTITVPDDAATVQGGVDLAVDGDVVCVRAGTWTELVNFGGRDIWLVGLEGRELTFLDGGGSGPVLTLANGESAHVAEFTIQNGAAAGGACVWAEGVSLELRDVTITGCTATERWSYGAGLYANQSQLWLDDVVVSDNVHLGGGYGGGLSLVDTDTVAEDLLVSGNIMDGYGGAGMMAAGGSLAGMDLAFMGNEAEKTMGVGLYLSQVDVDIQGLSVLDNVGSSGSGGAGLALHGVTGTIRDFVISGNTGESMFGGGASIAGGSLVLEDGLVDGNSVESGAGGGIYAYGDGVVIRDVVVSNNSASSMGGGVYAEVYGPVTLERVRIENNRGSSGGGLSLYRGGEVILRQSVVRNNVATSSGGGIRVYSDSSCEIDHTWVVDNEAGSSGGGGVVLYATAALTGSYLVLAGNTGGGLGTSADGVPLDLEHVAVVGNQVSGRGIGAGLHLEDGYDAVLAQSIVSANLGGPGVYSDARTTVTVNWTDAWGNEGGEYVGMTDPTGTSGNVAVDPSFLDTSGRLAFDWDLHLGLSSPLVDAGNPAELDPDGSRSDIGPYGGEGADEWDLDGDGFPAWWQPGPYTTELATQGWDCDDLDPGVGPGSGC